MKRFDIINLLIKKNGYKSYLEIGTQGDQCLSLVKCDYKVGVDPYPVRHDDTNSDKFFEMTSDDFFEQNKETFDIIFVDGLHHSGQVAKDIQNALSILEYNGCIVVHDCNPQTEAAQAVPQQHLKSWNGDVWKAWMKYRAVSTLSMFVVNTDHGCGVITDGSQNAIDIPNEKLTFRNLRKYRTKWLNLITKHQFLKYVNE